MIRNFTALAILLFAAACVMPPATVQPDEQVEIAFYTVTPQIEWNRAIYSMSGENWTVDGWGLQALRFFAVPNGQSLVQNRSTFGKPLPPDEKTPVFRSTMTPNEVREFFVETLATGGWAKVKTTALKPAKFGSLPGFRFGFSMLDEDGLEYDGLAYGAMRGEELHLIVYSGTRLHYFPKHKKTVENLFRSIRT